MRERFSRSTALALALLLAWATYSLPAAPSVPSTSLGDVSRPGLGYPMELPTAVVGIPAPGAQAPGPVEGSRPAPASPRETASVVPLAATADTPLDLTAVHLLALAANPANAPPRS